ncbi:MAG TPA: lipoyl(octanoyl) transferase LipB [Gemmatimonadaceae bacterium]
MPSLSVCTLGTMSYATALELQREAARGRIAGDLDRDVLLLVEHPPVVTLGRTSKPSHLQVSAQYLAERGIELFEVERGGDVTFHGPGQLVGYPVLDLKGLKPDLHWYLRQIEESLIRTLISFGLAAVRNPGYTGVWTRGQELDAVEADEGPGAPTRAVAGEPGGGRRAEDARATVPGAAPLADLPGGQHGALRKIASIGVHAREWVTWHGFALNVNTDLRYFELMVPCGLPDVRMSSLAQELGRHIAMDDVRRAVVESFREAFGYAEAVEIDAARLVAVQLP